MEQGEKMGLGKELAEDFKTPLPSPHTREPIMNNGHLHADNLNLFRGPPSG
jgi:hypothetical protein